MRLPGWKAVLAAARWAQARAAGRGLVLGYHRVADEPWDPHGLCVSPARFREHLEVLRRLAQPVALRDLLEERDDPRAPRRVAVTFDDGYREVATRALPLLEEAGVPATAFVLTGDAGTRPWWDDLARLLRPGVPLPDPLRVGLGGTDRAWPTASADRRRLVADVHRALLPLERAALRAALGELEAAIDATASGGGPRTLTAEEIAELDRSPAVEVASHTDSHPQLATLPPAAQRAELALGKRRLEEILSRPVDGLSYPNGSADASTRAEARRAGFAWACGSRNGAVVRSTDSFDVPRFWPGDWQGEAFERWLRRFIG